jgi:hypothetical protein
LHATIALLQPARLYMYTVLAASHHMPQTGSGRQGAVTGRARLPPKAKGL